KPTLSALSEFISRYKQARIAEENRQRKYAEETAANGFFNDDGRAKTCNRGNNCKSCRVVYCDVIAESAIKGIYRLLAKHAELIDVLGIGKDTFPGIGYEEAFEKCLHDTWRKTGKAGDEYAPAAGEPF
ncbi:hypothetical protein MBAV_003302, partial [Candidatus Magnetobacterium bavaricum]